MAKESLCDWCEKMPAKFLSSTGYLGYCSVHCLQQADEEADMLRQEEEIV